MEPLIPTIEATAYEENIVPTTEAEISVPKESMASETESLAP